MRPGVASFTLLPGMAAPVGGFAQAITCQPFITILWYPSPTCLPIMTRVQWAGVRALTKSWTDYTP